MRLWVRVKPRRVCTLAVAGSIASRTTIVLCTIHVALYIFYIHVSVWVCVCIVACTTAVQCSVSLLRCMLARNGRSEISRNRLMQWKNTFSWFLTVAVCVRIILFCYSLLSTITTTIIIIIIKSIEKRYDYRFIRFDIEIRKKMLIARKNHRLFFAFGKNSK